MLVSGGTKTLSGMLPRPHLGYLLTPDICKPVNVRLAKQSGCWAADNSAFSHFDPASFCGFLGTVARIPGCLWVTAPDIWQDSKTTLDRFNRWQPVLAEVGLPVAFVTQDGSEDLDMPWGRMACLFVGGSTAWKLSQASRDLIGEAKRRRKWVHVGRVNSLKRIRWCVECGVDSFDGSGFGMFPAVNVPKGLRWVAEALTGRDR